MMRHVIAVAVLSILISKVVMVAKSEQAIMEKEIADSYAELERSIGDPDQLEWKQNAN